jgi:DNA primase
VKNDAQVWRQAADSPIKIMDFYFESIMAKYDHKDVDGKKKIAQELLNVIAKVSNKIEQSFYVQRLSGEIGVEDKILQDILDGVKKERQNPARSAEAHKKPAETRKSGREYKLQENLLGFIALNPGIFAKTFAGLEELFEDKDFLNIYKEIEKCYQRSKVLKKEDLEQIKRKLSDKVSYLDGSQNLSFIFDTAVFSVESYMDDESFDPLREAEKCILSLREIILKKKMKGIELRIKEAEKNKDAKLLEELSKQQVDLIGKMQETGF